MTKYVIIVEKAGNNYSAFCPDLPGCVATGSTVEETVDRMKEAIKFHIEELKKGLKLTYCNPLLQQCLLKWQ